MRSRSDEAARIRDEEAMSVTEADVMKLMGETQEATTGARQADISAAITRQYEYEQGKREEFGTSFGPQLLDTAVRVVTGGVGMIGAIGGAPYVSPLEGNQIFQVE